MAQRRLKMVDRSTHERRQFQTHDRRRCGASSEVPSVGVLLPISGVAGSRRLQPSVGPSSSTQAQCDYGSEKQVRPVDTWCALGLATNEGPGAMKRRGSTCASHSPDRPDVLQRGVLTEVDLSDMQGPPLVWHCRNRALTELLTWPVTTAHLYFLNVSIIYNEQNSYKTTKSVFVLSHFFLNLNWPFRYRYRKLQVRSGAVVPGLWTGKCGGGRKIKGSE